MLNVRIIWICTGYVWFRVQFGNKRRARVSFQRRTKLYEAKGLASAIQLKSLKNSRVYVFLNSTQNPTITYTNNIHQIIIYRSIFMVTCVSCACM